MSDDRQRPNPFSALAGFERRSLAHSVGLPEQAALPGVWSGIGFRLDNNHLACTIGSVSEILTMPPLTRIPGAKDWVMGISNVRGNLVAVCDLRRFLYGERTQLTPSSRVLVARQEGGDVGLLIDEVLGQKHLLDEEIIDQSAISETPVGPFVSEVYRQGETDWGVFEMIRLTRSPDFTQAAA